MKQSKSAGPTIQVTGCGLVVVDILMMTDHIRTYHKNRVAHQAIQLGGVVPTALIVLSRLGVTTEIYTTIGDDLFGEALMTIFKKERVGIGHIIKVPETETPLAFVVIHEKTGNRTSFYTTGSFSNIKHDAFANTFGTKPQFLLVDGHNNEATFELMKKARKSGTTTLLDLGSPKKQMERLISYADIVIVPQAYSSVSWPKMSPESIIQKVLKFGPNLVVHTMEEKGCMVGQQQQKIFYQPSFPVKAVDTNGAGDVFLGTFTYGLCQSWPITKTAQFACAAAALSCTRIGKDQKIPHSEEEIFAFMNAQSPAK